MNQRLSLLDGDEILAGARVARLEMVNFRHDCGTPGEVGSLARACWLHLPELAARLGSGIAADEGHPPGISTSMHGLVNRTAEELVAARPMAEWLSGHVSPATAALFARGRGNSLHALFERLSMKHGFRRVDALAAESVATPSLGIDSWRVAAFHRSLTDRGAVL